MQNTADNFGGSSDLSEGLIFQIKNLCCAVTNMLMRKGKNQLFA